MSLPPVTGAPDSTDPVGPAGVPPEQRRIPHLGHALIFISFVGLLLIVLESVLAALGKSPASVKGGVVTVQHPMLGIAVEAGTYFVTLLAAWFFFPAMWHRSFLDGLSWHWSAARHQAGKLAVLGILLGVMSGVVSYFATTSKPPPIDQFFLTEATAWVLTLFGTVVAPVFEEICFRGFLLPAIAIAYDWLGMPRTEAAREHWQITTSLTTGGLLFSAILTSLLFTWLHAQQVAYSLAALLALFMVSMVLTWVRVKTQSVAASALVHASYNGFVFLVTLIGTDGYRHLDRMLH